ncbi:hypothetical protein CCB81_13175 [Armatimonadetes bacterium Uphvl-Ar2]|nr:hypothetical protein CCB81_13175 [Armatimonadetes bacterium Uphvl-Ar2]
MDTRVGTVQGGVSRTFVRDGSYVTDPVLRDGQATYTPGVSERRGGVSTWSHSGLKNADAQTTSVGAIAATRVYDAFGAELSATGTWKGPFGYAGGLGYQEDSSGLKLLGHRYYDPTTGRFLSRDPIKDARNWYVYCSAAPLSRQDRRGLYGEIEFIGNDIGQNGFPFGHGRVIIRPDINDSSKDYEIDFPRRTFDGNPTTDPVTKEENSDVWSKKRRFPDGHLMLEDEFANEMRYGNYNFVTNNCWHIVIRAAEVASRGEYRRPFVVSNLSFFYMRAIDGWTNGTGGGNWDPPNGPGLPGSIAFKRNGSTVYH